MPAPEPIYATRTTTNLLNALHDHSNVPAWAQIDARYRPVIAGLARRLGLDRADADEVSQQALTEFVQSYRDGRYDRTKGRLSSWILGIARHTALRMLRDARRGGNGGAGGGDSARVEAMDEPALRSIWDEERDRSIVSRAIALLRDACAVDDRSLLAFELVALRGVPPVEAAAQTGMTLNHVYVAKNRLTNRLRDLVQDMTAGFEDDS
jgi:RNA polymerase sigma-70 factor (ECF subfamily)